MLAAGGASYAHLVLSHPDWTGAAAIAGKTAVIYVFLVLGLRLFGKRSLGQMNIYDLVLVVVLANAVQNAMVGNDTTLAGGLVSAVTLLLLNWLMSNLIARSPRAEQVMVGSPEVLVNHGHLITANLRRQGIPKDQVMEALREHEIDDLAKVRLAVLEADGTISVVPDTSSVVRTRRHYRGVRLG
ncbi:MAG: DUF421 domain-containing protein [Solirubrobacterales bacterium]|nr:DUF421 domain-containing protein [Solirubrobacterales bacterium]